MSYHQITENIWIGSIMSLRADRSLVEAGVTHVLSVFGPDGGIVEDQASMPLLAKIEKHKRVEIEDMEDANLLQHFSETNAFIDDAVSQNKGVLVHCIAGISRSVTCVVAYLMQANKWDAHDAIEFVRSKRAIACPNTGFREQLETYYKCGYNVTEDSKPYREWLLVQQARSSQYHGLYSEQGRLSQPVYTQIEMPAMVIIWKQLVPSLLKRGNHCISPEQINVVKVNDQIFSVMEPVAGSLQRAGPVSELKLNDLVIPSTALQEVLDKLVTQTVSYRCKGCSTVLASSASLRPHKQGSRGLCQHYFFEPIEWMRPELEKGELEGRLVCPKCTRKVGSYNWAGVPCSCAVWVTPAFKLSTAKVDKMSSVSRALL